MLDHHKALINAEMAARENQMRSATLTPQVMARLCLVSSFLEDGLRMLSQWSEQQDYVNQVLSFHFINFKFNPCRSATLDSFSPFSSSSSTLWGSLALSSWC